MSITKYGLFGKLKALPGQGQALADFLLEAARLLDTASGCQLYLVSTDVTDADTIWVTEVWDTQEDHDRSLQAPAIRELIGRAMPLLAERPEPGMTVNVLGGKGLA
ncbi:putative quinol monooxygenase [Siphonobacter curvatus]|uniref:Antibiotic biosynthesis monooxygenase n=1 Tax=Siphonobacter curvatus TaxID=2094562 RepID=A0A2S7IGP3_9BACT|nr:antibiotic biosynthesis monooxygenase family protein [Siphonobacter curvatus]PQA54873.1 antibiotic biosynthesis monooxygenase [Siphonobacter curvatus]